MCFFDEKRLSLYWLWIRGGARQLPKSGGGQEGRCCNLLAENGNRIPQKDFRPHMLCRKIKCTHTRGIFEDFSCHLCMLGALDRYILLASKDSI